MANKHGQNARLGAIGESYVQMRLMQKGWDAFNANSTYNNYKLVDIICLKPGENGAFPPTRDGCIHSLSMRERG